jgi:hypothetical protein
LPALDGSRPTKLVDGRAKHDYDDCEYSTELPLLIALLTI